MAFVHIQKHLLSDEQIIPLCSSLGNQFVIITDTTVKKIYGQALLEHFISHGMDVKMIAIPPGECYKTRDTKIAIEDELLSYGYGRDTCILALGGGVICDLVGFIAATYCRSVPYVSFPTTLVAMVDAAIGGKTGINTVHGKNLIGCFYSPKMVLMDPNVLNTLSRAELSNGLVESIKHGLVADPSLLHFLMEYPIAIEEKDEDTLKELVVRSSSVKLNITQKDPFEKGFRRILNLGHTVGHAIERSLDYDISHGKAVAIGLVVEGLLSVKRGFLQIEDLETLIGILNLYRIPYHLPERLSFERFINAMSFDKKSKAGKLRIVMLKEIGSCHSFDEQYCSDLIFEELKEVMTTLQAMPKKQAMNDCKINSKKILNELLR